MTVIRSFKKDIQLAKLCYKLQIGSQLADGPLRTLDGYLAQLNQLGLFTQSIVLGPVVLTRAYGVDGPNDSGQVIQAAVTSDFGAAAVVWNSEDYHAAQDDYELERDALDRAVALRKCAPAIRSLVWPHVSELVDELMGRVTIV